MEAAVTHRTFSQTTVYLTNVESNKMYAGVWKAENHVGGWQGVAKLPVARSGYAKTRGTWRSRASRDYVLCRCHYQIWKFVDIRASSMADTVDKVLAKIK